ncbi:ATP-binding protein [Priestia abyssalis]|uniref:ATP-binding protein n=1 Tax=Priestia abyssalis TaxID=1221450 RepID=UPI001115C88E|nr:ATP-binding protein [Priestia abyssalis]
MNYIRNRKLKAIISLSVMMLLILIAINVIAEEEKDRIFQKGYLTKNRKQGKARGQSLSIVQEMVRKYRGEINLDSSEEKTSFKIRIPIYEQT